MIMDPEATLQPQSHETVRRDRQDLVARLQASEIFRDYRTAFEAITGLPLALSVAGTFQPPLHGNKRGNGLCALLASRNKTCAACLELQERLETAACLRPGTAECFAGLTESAVPIRVGGEVVAYLQTGQILLEAPSAKKTRQAVQRVAELDPTLDRGAIEQAFRASPVMAKSRYDQVLRLLEIFAGQLATVSNQLMLAQVHTEPPAITRAREFIARNLAEPMSLSDVARAAGMSMFYFCTHFRQSTGLNFTEYVSRTRVEAVKQLLLNPYKRISEAAFEAGFQSLSQFNRAFSRIAGQSPSVYREQLHGPAVRGQAA